MENKKTKLTISGNPKRSFKNFDSNKSQGKKTVIIDKQKSGSGQIDLDSRNFRAFLDVFVTVCGFADDKLVFLIEVVDDYRAVLDFLSEGNNVFATFAQTDGRLAFEGSAFTEID